MWTNREVWKYLDAHNIPALPLYEKGYTSIGCALVPSCLSILEMRAPAAGMARSLNAGFTFSAINYVTSSYAVVHVRSGLMKVGGYQPAACYQQAVFQSATAPGRRLWPMAAHLVGSWECHPGRQLVMGM